MSFNVRSTPPPAFSASATTDPASGHVVASNPRDSFTSLLSLEPVRLLASATFKRSYPHIGECECELASRIDNPGLRSGLETALIAKIQKSCPLSDPGDPPKIEIFSLGSGGCFQELVILNQLLSAGYRRIRVSLIDSCYRDKIQNCFQVSMLSAEEFERCVKEDLLPSYPDAVIDIHTYTDLNNALNENNRADDSPQQVFLLIDLQDEKDENNLSILNEFLQKLFDNNKIPSNAILAYTDSVRSLQDGQELVSSYSTCENKSALNFNDRLKLAVKKVINEIETDPVRYITSCNAVTYCNPDSPAERNSSKQ